MKNLLILILFLLSALYPSCATKAEKAEDTPDSVRLSEMFTKAGDEWIATLRALEMTESECWPMFPDEDNKDRRGIFNLTKDHVREANRIMGHRLYIIDSTLYTDNGVRFFDARIDEIVSVQIFTIYNSVHNPSFNANTAMLLLRPEATYEYKKHFSAHLETFLDWVKSVNPE